MAPKPITTAHTVVQCDVCGRTLLRGEFAEAFIAGGERRVVCELCAPRAAHEGWMREGFDEMGVRPGRSRSRSLIGRLRARRDEYLARQDGPARHETLDGVVPPVAERDVHAVPTNAELKMVRALEVFNASEQARMVGGIARALGTPTVTVRPSRTEGAVVSIVTAWEITWYRFEVDLGNEAAGVRVTEKGAELDELEPEDLMPNAVAGGDGTLSFAR
ncbi:MAG TPA: hypothetical protein VHB30_05305 [Solirubrobacteraceae bacterium]|nr:hypothetical protein [Solirubrobacteraceae bacterium]